MSEVYDNHNTASRVFCRWSLRPVQDGAPARCPDECPDSHVIGSPTVTAGQVAALERPPSTPMVISALESASVLGAGTAVGAVRVSSGKLGLLLGEPEVRTVLVEGTLAQLQAWVENLRLQLVDIPTTATCRHCVEPIVKARPGEPWRDEDDLASCPALRAQALPHVPADGAATEADQR